MDIAEAMAARLNALEALPDVETLVDRQKDIAAHVAKQVSKAAGAAITILYEGFSNSDRSGASNLKITRRYSVSVFSKPVLRSDSATPADDIVEAVAACLHRWEAPFGEIVLTGCDMRPDSRYLIYDLDLEVLTTL